MSDNLIEEARRLVWLSCISVPEHTAMIERLITRIESLESEPKDVAVSATEIGELPSAVEASVAYLKSMGYDEAAESLQNGWFGCAEKESTS